jgi:type IV secretion system protein TrbH
MIRFSAAIRLVPFLVSTLVLAGCQTFGGTGLVASSAYAELTPEAANAIAGDIVGRLAEHVGPGASTIQLKPDGSTFGQALETSLKSWGYAVVTDQTAEAANLVPLAYVVDPFEGSVLARISTSAVNLTRVYQVTATGATPTSPLSVMNIGEGTPT